jgi:hypothetical protein
METATNDFLINMQITLSTRFPGSGENHQHLNIPINFSRINFLHFEIHSQTDAQWSENFHFSFIVGPQAEERELGLNSRAGALCIFSSVSEVDYESCLSCHPWSGNLLCFRSLVEHQYWNILIYLQPSIQFIVNNIYSQVCKWSLLLSSISS